jgi:site-specific DNA-methyltransferase (adenine-specific)
MNTPPHFRLVRADALDYLSTVPAESFDLIIADPPYFLSGGGTTCHSGRRVSVDKGRWDAVRTLDDMHRFNRTWLRLCQRLLRPNGSLWVSGTHHNIFSVGYALQTLGYKILNVIAWHKVNPPPNLSCRYFTHATETLIWAARNDAAQHTFHYADMKQLNGGKQMQSLWHIPPPRPVEKKYGKHPAQKPEALIERIIQASSNPDDAILDPFCGSGTVGIVCARFGRRFVGVDLSDEFLEIASLRLSAERVVFTFERWESKERTAQSAKTTTDGQATWASLVRYALETLGGEAHLREINRVVENDLRTETNRTWQCTVRRVVRQSAEIEPLGQGRYRLRSESIQPITVQ